MQWLKLPAWKVPDRRFVPYFGIQRNKLFLPCSLVKIQYCGEPLWLRCSGLASDRQGPNFESCVWRAVSSHSSHRPQEVLLAQFSLYMYKSVLKPHSFIHLLQVFIKIWRGVILLRIQCTEWSLPSDDNETESRVWWYEMQTEARRVSGKIVKLLDSNMYSLGIAYVFNFHVWVAKLSYNLQSNE